MQLDLSRVGLPKQHKSGKELVVLLLMHSR
jgi:hypothetical protein